MLKRRRAGVVEVEEETDSEEVDSESDALAENVAESSLGDRNLDAYDSDFLDDRDDTVGVDLGRQGVPLEFTYHANKKPIENFKAEIEWMVHNKLNPAFDRNDEIYILAHRKLDDEVQGYAGSKFVSSVWREDFNKALKSRPDFFRFDVPTMLDQKCDACNRSGHPPKHRVTFSGKPYNHQTLETISHNDEDEDSDDGEDSNTTIDEQSFFLGRFCCANAEIAHALHHWRYALNQTVLEWLATHGHLTPDKIVQREKWSQKKRAKDANKIVDGMEEEGVMKILYRQFKENLDAARSAKVSNLLPTVRYMYPSSLFPTAGAVVEWMKRQKLIIEPQILWRRMRRYLQSTLIGSSPVSKSCGIGYSRFMRIVDSMPGHRMKHIFLYHRFTSLRPNETLQFPSKRTSQCKRNSFAHRAKPCGCTRAETRISYTLGRTHSPSGLSLPKSSFPPPCHLQPPPRPHPRRQHFPDPLPHLHLLLLLDDLLLLHQRNRKRHH